MTPTPPTGYWQSTRGENHGLNSQPGDKWVSSTPPTPPVPEESKGMCCDSCASQEGLHYCLLHGKPMRDMNISVCEDWTARIAETKPDTPRAPSAQIVEKTDVSTEAVEKLIEPQGDTRCFGCVSRNNLLRAIAADRDAKAEQLAAAIRAKDEAEKQREAFLILAEKSERRAAAATKQSEEQAKRIAELEGKLKWLDNNTTFYDVNSAGSNVPVLASVSKRIWYHATDDQRSYPFSAVIAARAALSRSRGEVK